MMAIRFEVQPPVSPPDPYRADVACFVGFVATRQARVLPEIARWLGERGWPAEPPLENVPVPIDEWDTFDRLFAWDRRDLTGDGVFGDTYLGAAVRSFFHQGGRKCYVVPAGPPEPLAAFEEPVEADRIRARLARLIPGYSTSTGARVTASAAEPHGWEGIGHLFGLPDVSFVSLPDIPDIVGFQVPASRLPDPPPPHADWAECSEPQVQKEEDKPLAGLAAPRCDQQRYRYWARAIGMVAAFLNEQLREMQLVAAVPLAAPELGVEGRLLEFLVHGDATLRQRGFQGPLARSPLDEGHPAQAFRGMASAFVQLAWPWLRTGGSGRLPEGLESPEGVLTGVLAHNALTRGTFRHASKVRLADMSGLFPVVSLQQVNQPVPDDPDHPDLGHTLAERVSLFGPTPDGLRLLSDATTSRSAIYRSAPVSRLVGAILRAARRLGETVVFDANGQALWEAIRDQLEALLGSFQRAGALGTAAGERAFRVRCDRSTISQNDLDHGRVVAEVEFAATSPIGELVVVLALDPAGQVSLATVSPVREEAA